MLKAMEEDIERDAAFQNIRMETEAGIDAVQFKVGAVRQSAVQELLRTFDVLDAFRWQLWWHG